MKRYILAVTAAAAVLSAAPVGAQVIPFQGTARGCFGAGCTPGIIDTDSALIYGGGSFNQNTDATGFLGIGGSSDNLGSFTLGSAGHNYNGDIFNLLVTFTLPAGTSPNSTSYSTLLKGIVTSGANNGSVFVDFDNSVRNFAFDGGTFTFNVNDISVSSNSAVQYLSGQIQASVPEPATWAMMLLGFGGIGMAMRRRRQPALAQVA